ncbi:M48 family metalloprotease [Aurantiacibacter rhizosphaerae]|uniref:M48 family metalloprotease n=1 Tax=Aurantiacibacter rhizosphaerae TaxID=2691582 RepID=A0A844X7W5_9SPHN|nr:M48 family metalloprotease [Aurantiacibacter rhizosphaerae]MWV26427.1 M48 family metalloprotease [Aurantiacibacter rhizosphaerae]
MATFKTLAARLLAVCAALALTVQPAMAQNISVLRDAETETLLQDMVDPLAEAAGLGEAAVEIVLINDGSINAFVAGGQRIFVHSGLINAADHANEVEGVLAHELGHITGGHINRFSEGVGNASKISLLTTLLAVGAALAGGGEAAMGVMAAGQQAAMGSFLAFSRTQEASADAAGAQFLSDAGISGRGSLAFFEKLQDYEFRRNINQSADREYSRTHPLSGNRIARLREQYVEDPAWDTPPDPVMEERFQRAKAKLFGYLAKPERTLIAYPTYMTAAPARYARAYAYHQSAQVDKALEEVNALIASDPDDPYFLELKGQILLESGHVEEALPPLRRATQITGSNPLIATSLGHALIATEDPANLEEAEGVLRAAVGRDHENPSAWYQLGVVYGQRGDIPRARLASAEQLVMQGNAQAALLNAQAAENGLPTGSADWIRAQDVALQARGLLERQRDRN